MAQPPRASNATNPTTASRIDGLFMGNASSPLHETTQSSSPAPYVHAAVISDTSCENIIITITIAFNIRNAIVLLEWLVKYFSC
jgi:hypothetical protein